LIAIFNYSAVSINYIFINKDCSVEVTYFFKPSLIQVVITSGVTYEILYK